MKGVIITGIETTRDGHLVVQFQNELRTTIKCYLFLEWQNWKEDHTTARTIWRTL